MDKIMLLDLQPQYESIGRELETVVNKVLRSGNYILGPEVKHFEEEVAAYCGARHAIGVANGTDALVLVMDAMGIGDGDEVITTPFTFFATAGTVSRLGAVPVFVDIDPDTYNIDVNQIEQAITPKTKAIMPVHIFGQPVDIDSIKLIADRHNLKVIEDAAQAFGAEYRGKKIGAYSDATTFSFYPTKNLGCYGDGGIIVTNSDELAAKIRMLRVQGRDPNTPKYYHKQVGYNSRLDEIQAAMLRIKLRYIDTWNTARRSRAYAYNQKLNTLPLITPYHAPDRKHVYHLYMLQGENRNNIMKHLNDNGISSGVYYPMPLHLQEVYKYLGYTVGSLPNAEEISKKIFALPMYPELDDSKIDKIVSVLESYFKIL